MWPGSVNNYKLMAISQHSLLKMNICIYMYCTPEKKIVLSREEHFHFSQRNSSVHLHLNYDVHWMLKALRTLIWGNISYVMDWGQMTTKGDLLRHANEPHLYILLFHISLLKPLCLSEVLCINSKVKNAWVSIYVKNRCLFCARPVVTFICL